jgi:hypothetical protein
MSGGQSKREWEPKPGDPVAILGGGWTTTVSMATVIRLTKTQIVVRNGANETRFRRAQPWTLGGEYPRFREVGAASRPGFGRALNLTHPESADVAAIRAEKERDDRVHAVLRAQDVFRQNRDVESAKAVQRALSEFIQHEEGASEG